MSNTNRQFLKNITLILIGNSIYAMAVTMFIIPNGLITGGTTGLALLFNRLAGLDIAIFVLAFNLLMFVIGGTALGWKFALTTLLSTLYYPLALGLCQRIPQLQNMTSDQLLAAIYAGLMIGLGIGIVIRAGASTGGMDIPPLVLNRKLGLSISVVLYVLDVCILFGQMFIANKEQVLYGILLVLIYTMVLDQVLFFGQAKTQVQIISAKYEEINAMVNGQLDRGSTLIHSETGYVGNDWKMVLTVISNRELTKLTDMVLSIDPKAFMIINRTYQVQGRGFTMDKSYK